MQDGHTRKLDRSELNQGLFLARNRATLVVVEGTAVGAEHVLDQPSLAIGRGPGVDITFADESMSKQHVAIELGGEGYRIRDMGSTNGMLINGSKSAAADLKHGDRIQIGEHTLQYMVEEKERVGTYELKE
jgi:pSer/pThr/pTyr-binding forkhead associated (FHA) protein